MLDEDLHNIERMLNAALAKGEVSLILPGSNVVSASAQELATVFSQAALFRKLVGTLTPEQMAACYGQGAPGVTRPEGRASLPAPQPPRDEPWPSP